MDGGSASETALPRWTSWRRCSGVNLDGVYAEERKDEPCDFAKA
jgi:hypothetical protein